jgi:hypothetical protein
VKPLFEYKIVTIDHVRHLQDARLTLVDPAGTQRSVAIYQQYRTGVSLFKALLLQREGWDIPSARMELSFA